MFLCPARSVSLLRHAETNFANEFLPGKIPGHFLDMKIKQHGNALKEKKKKNAELVGENANGKKRALKPFTAFAKDILMCLARGML